jgi:integrase
VRLALRDSRRSSAQSPHETPRKRVGQGRRGSERNGVEEMALFRPTYTDQKTGRQKQSAVWWYEFIYAGKRIRESTKTTRKTIAAAAEKKRRLELERGFNAIEDRREKRIKTIAELSATYLETYKVRHRSTTFAEYALGHVSRHVGTVMAIDVQEQTVKDYQTARLKEKAAAKSINEEVGFLLRLLGDRGDAIRAKLHRERALKLKLPPQIGKAYSPEQKAAMLAAAKAARSPHIYPALTLALNAGMRDAEIKGLQWERIDLAKAVLTVGDSKSEAGEGRTIPLNSDLLTALVNHATWYTKQFGATRPEWYVFPWGAPRPSDPTRPMVTLKTSWSNVRRKAGVKGRWHDNRHTMITDLAEGGTPDEVIRDIAGHVSKQMLKHYSHVRMEAKRKALQGLVPQEPTSAKDQPVSAEIHIGVLQEVPKVTLLN